MGNDEVAVVEGGCVDWSDGQNDWIDETNTKFLKVSKSKLTLHENISVTKLRHWNVFEFKRVEAPSYGPRLHCLRHCDCLFNGRFNGNKC